MNDAPLLRAGAQGEAVRELQKLLRAAGIDPGESGAFDAATEVAVRAFQKRRRLRVDGICGPETWGALEESGHSLGGRLLCRRSPMMRGDDVVELQTRLNALGFDAGRADGIFGPQTEAALVAFQRDAAVTVDRICGPETIAALARLGTPGAGSVAATRERDALRRGTRSVSGLRVLVSGDVPGDLGDRVVADLVGVDAVGECCPGGAADEIATRANAIGADLVVHLTLSEQNITQCAYFENASMRSEGGLRLAEGIGAALRDAGMSVAAPIGRTSRLLRETRMPAVICELAEPGRAGLAAAIVAGIRRTIEAEDLM